MENNELLKQQLENLKEKIKEYEEVMKDLFGTYLLAITDDGNISLLSEEGIKYDCTCDTNDQTAICFSNKEENKYNSFTISKLENHTSVIETNIDYHQRGATVEYIDRLYGKSNYYNCCNALLDLRSINYVVSNKDYDELEDLLNQDYVRAISKHTTEFSVHMRYFYKLQDEARRYSSTMYPAHVYFNHQDVSYVFDYVEGLDKLKRIYNLYKGKVNPNSKDIEILITGLVDEESFNYQKKKINNEVVSLIGKKLKDDYKDEMLNEYILSHIDKQSLVSITSEEQEENNVTNDESKVKRFIKRIFKR